MRWFCGICCYELCVLSRNCLLCCQKRSTWALRMRRAWIVRLQWIRASMTLAVTRATLSQRTLQRRARRRRSQRYVASISDLIRFCRMNLLDSYVSSCVSGPTIRQPGFVQWIASCGKNDRRISWKDEHKCHIAQQEADVASCCHVVAAVLEIPKQSMLLLVSKNCAMTSLSQYLAYLIWFISRSSSRRIAENIRNSATGKNWAKFRQIQLFYIFIIKLYRKVRGIKEIENTHKS